MDDLKTLRIIENHLDILHLFWVHGDTIPDKEVNKNVLVSFNQKININPHYIESIYFYKKEIIFMSLFY